MRVIFSFDIDRPSTNQFYNKTIEQTLNHYLKIITLSVLSAKKYYKNIKFYTNSNLLIEKLSFLDVEFVYNNKKRNYYSESKLISILEESKVDLDFFYMDIDVFLGKKLQFKGEDLECDTKYGIYEAHYLNRKLEEYNDVLTNKLYKTPLLFVPSILKFNNINIINKWEKLHNQVIDTFKGEQDAHVVEEVTLANVMFNNGYSFNFLSKNNDYIHVNGKTKFSNAFIEMVEYTLISKYPNQWKSLVSIL